MMKFEESPVKGLYFAEKEVVVTMCPPTEFCQINGLGVRLNACIEESSRSTAKELRHTKNKCLLTIGRDIQNIGEDVDK